MASAGPAQRFPSNIIKISFPAIGGLVFFRVAQRWDGSFAAPAAVAKVTGLPWDDFDLFDGIDRIDPDGKPDEDVSISNPVSDAMLTKYLHWNQYKPVGVASNGTTPPFEQYIVDIAHFTEVYNHHITSRVYEHTSKEIALAYFQGAGLLPGQDASLVGVVLVTNTFENYVIPSPKFFEDAAAGGWEYHIETTPGSTIYRRDDAATVIFNLAKLFRDVPNDPVTKKKPAQVHFKVELPTKAASPPGTGGLLSWKLQAAAFKSKLSDPPNFDERRDFPVEDVVKPVSGIPGAFTTDYLTPKGWPFPYPFADVKKSDVPAGVTQFANVTITFGAAKVAPLVEIELDTGGGGGPR